MHFSYKETVLLSLRTEGKDTELFPELTSPHRNNIVTHTHNVQQCDVSAEFQRLELAETHINH